MVVPRHVRAGLLAAVLGVLIGGCQSERQVTAPTPAPVPTPAPTPTGGSCSQPESIEAPRQGWPCPSAADVAAVRSAVRIDIVEDPTAPDLVGRASEGSVDLTRLEERLYQALLLMRRVRFDAPLPWTGRTLWDWFTAEVRTVRMRGRDTFCCEPGRAIVLAVRPTYEPGYPTLIEGLVHEARHADGQHPHSCGNSDNTIAELGAFGVQYYLNVWLGEHSGPYLTDEEKRYTRNRAEWMRLFSFCAECR